MIGQGYHLTRPHPDPPGRLECLAGKRSLGIVTGLDNSTVQHLKRESVGDEHAATFGPCERRDGKPFGMRLDLEHLAGEQTRRRCHNNLDRCGAGFGRRAPLRPRWRLATSGTLRLLGREACGGM